MTAMTMDEALDMIKVIAGKVTAGTYYPALKAFKASPGEGDT